MTFGEFKQYDYPSELPLEFVLNRAIDEKLIDMDKIASFHWQSFRANAAKDILCAALMGGIVRGADGFVEQKETLVKGAIEVADELIRQLKEDEK